MGSTVVNLSSQNLASLDMLENGVEAYGLDKDNVKHIDISSNVLRELSDQIICCRFIDYLNVSNNMLTTITAEIKVLTFLRVIDLRNNQFTEEGIPYEFSSLSALEEVNMSGNNLIEVPLPILKLENLRSLYLGSNRISKLSPEISRGQKLRVLYLGGNLIESLPDQLSDLQNLEVLSLAENKLRFLPASFGRLKRLRSLMLNNNQLSCLPMEIVQLPLEELSLRNNPLLVNFVAGYHQQVPSLLELAGRAIRSANLRYQETLPPSLVGFLDSAQRCVNPRCQGVYFHSHVSNVKFIDICGKYQVPMLQYLCSPRCRTTAASPPTVDSSALTSNRPLASSSNIGDVDKKLRRVLLG